MKRGLMMAAVALLSFSASAVAGPVMSPVARAQFNRCQDRTVSANVRLSSCSAIIEAVAGPPADMAVALNNRGIAYENKGNYVLAVQDFNEAIRLQPYYATAFNNRGFARFVLGEFASAASDLGRGLQINPSYPYAALWRYIALAHARQPYRRDLEQRQTQIGLQNWPGPIIELFLGTASPADVKAAMGAAPGQEASRACEVGFYIGEYRLIQGDDAGALSLLQNAAQGCSRESIEFYGAQAELKRLYMRVMEKTEK